MNSERNDERRSPGWWDKCQWGYSNGVVCGDYRGNHGHRYEHPFTATPPEPSTESRTLAELKLVREAIREGRTMSDDQAERCAAVIWHGPGHQSRTQCRRRGKHKVHSAIFGRYDQQACWKGLKAFSGFFDEAIHVKECDCE